MSSRRHTRAQANGKGSQMSTFRWSNSTEVGNAERIATVAFDPNGTGKDEYIANLVFDKSSERLRLYVTNKDREYRTLFRLVMETTVNTSRN